MYDFYLSLIIIYIIIVLYIFFNNNNNNLCLSNESFNNCKILKCQEKYGLYEGKCYILSTIFHRNGNTYLCNYIETVLYHTSV